MSEPHWYEVKRTDANGADKEVWRRDIPLIGFLLVTVNRDERVAWRIVTGDSRVPAGEAPDVKSAMYIAVDVLHGILTRAAYDLED